MKRARRIEDLLSWAYLEELPKGRSLSDTEAVWQRLEQYGSIGGVDIDHSSLLRMPDGEPHPDAVVIGKAVTALGKVSIAEHIDIIAGELHALVDINDFRPRPKIKVPGKTSAAGYYDADGAPPLIGKRRDVLALSTINITAMVVHHAVLGTAPEWSGGQPQPFPIASRRGAMIVGECRAKNYYTTGTYCPVEWRPSPLQIILSRADYHLWHRALCGLAETLNLSEHEALPPEASPAPWIEVEKKHRVFSYVIGPQDFLPLKPQRERAGPPLRKFNRTKAAKSLLFDEGNG